MGSNPTLSATSLNPMILRACAPRRGAMYAGLYAVPSYLTRRGPNAIFQIRVPKRLDPDLRLAPISVALGPMREPEARRLATRMAGRAMDVFAKHPEGSEAAIVRDVTLATLALMDVDPYAFTWSAP